MSDVHLLFRRHGRVLVPLLAVYLAVGIAAVILRHQAQAWMVFGLVTVLVSVGATVYAFDYQFRFFDLGEDRLFHLSSATRVRTSLRSSAVLFAYLAAFYIVGRTCSLAMGETPYGDWLDGLGGGLVQKLASLAAGLGVVLLVSAAIKGVRGRLFLRGIGWAGAVVVFGACVAGMIAWAIAQSTGQEPVEWTIGASSDPNTTTVYAGVIPVLTPNTHDMVVTSWAWCAINAGLAVVTILGFLALTRVRRMNFLEE